MNRGTANERRRRRVVRLLHLGMPERVLITRPTHVQWEVRCLALPTDRVVYGITIHYPSSSDEESRSKHLSGVACATSQRSRLRNISAESLMQHHNGVAHATSQRSHGNISSQQLKGKRDARLEMVRGAHGAAPGQRYEYHLNAQVRRPGRRRNQTRRRKYPPTSTRQSVYKTLESQEATSLDMYRG